MSCDQLRRIACTELTARGTEVDTRPVDPIPPLLFLRVDPRRRNWRLDDLVLEDEGENCSHKGSHIST